MGPVGLPMLLAAWAAQHALQDSKAVTNIAIAHVAAGLHLCLATGRQLVAMSALQPAQRE